MPFGNLKGILTRAAGWKSPGRPLKLVYLQVALYFPLLFSGESSEQDHRVLRVQRRLGRSERHVQVNRHSIFRRRRALAEIAPSKPGHGVQVGRMGRRDDQRVHDVLSGSSSFKEVYER